VVDLVPFRDRVLVALPRRLDPFAAVDEITITAEDEGFISQSGGYANQGEKARLVCGHDGKVREVWLGGIRYVPERRIKMEMKRKYIG
jgi:hypothetical protein